MAEFVSSFITGFQSIIEKDLSLRLKGIKILNLFDGLVHYRFDGDSRELEKIIYFNNTFFVLKTIKKEHISFPQLVNEVINSRNYFLVNKGSFRIRFQNENQFTGVDKNLTRKAEEYVLRNSKLKLDRLSPSNEIWFSIRREGFAFSGELITHREFTEKNLNKGELRPEIAFLIACFAGLKGEEVIAEPFSGYGSIPVQIAKRFKFSKLYVSDIDKEKTALLKEKKALQNEAIDVRDCDAMKLSHIEDKSVDIIVTDPPWGFYEDIGDVFVFYKRMFESFKRILKTGGKMIVLSARKEKIEKALDEMNIQIIESLHTLVNGKKTVLYKLSFSS